MLQFSPNKLKSPGFIKLTKSSKCKSIIESKFTSIRVVHILLLKTKIAKKMFLIVYMKVNLVS